MSNIRLSDFNRVSCIYIQKYHDEFLGVYKLSGGDPCRECGWNLSGDCTGHIELSKKDIIRSAPVKLDKGLSNAEIAKRLTEKFGTVYTPRKVSKLRANGLLELLLM